jgi:hypothetical protein
MIQGYLISLLLAVCMFFLGWVLGSSTIATECERLGGFYVGSTVYECKPKKQGGQND